jgi:hypothetical protein
MKRLWSQWKKVGGQDETDTDRAKTIERGIAVMFLLVSTRVAPI